MPTMKTKEPITNDYRKQNLRRFIEARVSEHGGWRAFARACGQDYQKIKKWAESGNPTLESLISLCDAIGVSLPELAAHIEGLKFQQTSLASSIYTNDEVVDFRNYYRRGLPVHTLQRLVAIEARRRGRQRFLEDSGITEDDLSAIEQGTLEGDDLAGVIGCLSAVLPYSYEELVEMLESSNNHKSLEDSCQKTLG
jgi:hypothetical protein